MILSGQLKCTPNRSMPGALPQIAGAPLHRCCLLVAAHGSSSTMLLQIEQWNNAVAIHRMSLLTIWRWWSARSNSESRKSARHDMSRGGKSVRVPTISLSLSTTQMQQRSWSPHKWSMPALQATFATIGFGTLFGRLWRVPAIAWFSHFQILDSYFRYRTASEEAPPHQKQRPMSKPRWR